MLYFAYFVLLIVEKISVYFAYFFLLIVENISLYFAYFAPLIIKKKQKQNPQIWAYFAYFVPTLPTMYFTHTRKIGLRISKRTLWFLKIWLTLTNLQEKKVSSCTTNKWEVFDPRSLLRNNFLISAQLNFHKVVKKCKKVQKSDIQSQISWSKCPNLSNFFFIEEYKFMTTFFVKVIFR